MLWLHLYTVFLGSSGTQSGQLNRAGINLPVTGRMINTRGWGMNNFPVTVLGCFESERGLGAGVTDNWSSQTE